MSLTHRPGFQQVLAIPEIRSAARIQIKLPAAAHPDRPRERMGYAGDFQSRVFGRSVVLLRGRCFGGGISQGTDLPIDDAFGGTVDSVNHFLDTQPANQQTGTSGVL
jgi:hypothetical protein